jgi:two-component system phosphate regulon response regulator OmpR
MIHSPASDARRLLAVDDESELRSLLVEYLGRHGFTVREAADAAAARAAVAEQVPALVLLDVHMPGESGLSLARWLREAHPRTGLMMLTTAGESVDRVVGLEVGADDYIVKPFEPRELLARVRALLRRIDAGAREAAAPAPATHHRRLGAWPSARAGWTSISNGSSAATAPRSRSPRPSSTCSRSSHAIPTGR